MEQWQRLGCWRNVGSFEHVMRDDAPTCIIRPIGQADPF